MKIGKWLEEEGLTLLRNWARSGLSDPEIARRMGVGPGTLNRWRRRYLAVAQAYVSGAKVDELVTAKLTVSLQSDWTVTNPASA